MSIFSIRGRRGAPTLVVSTSAQILTAMATLAPTGGTILCTPGTYSYLLCFRVVSSGSGITVRSQNPLIPCLFNAGIRVEDCGYITFENIDVMVRPVGQSGGAMAFRLNNNTGWPPTHHITIKNCRIFGLQSDALSGYGTGIDATRGNNITVEGNEVYYTALGINISNTTAVTLKDNYLHHIRTDMIDVAGTSNILITGNLFRHNMKVPPDHSDGIQVLMGLFGSPVGDITITGNVIMAEPDVNTSPLSAGIIFTADASAQPWYNVLVQGNAIIGTPSNSIRVGLSTGSVVNDNLSIPWNWPVPPDGVGDPVWSYPIYITDSVNATITNNKADGSFTVGNNTGTFTSTGNTTLVDQTFGDFSLFNTWKVGRTNLHPNLNTLMADVL